MSDTPHLSPLQRWLREPLAPFLVVGLALSAFMLVAGLGSLSS
jgi:hypothetical protein